MAASVLAAILVYMISAQALEVSARSAVLLDGDSGEILWEKNAQQRSLIASTTKIMTALVTLEQMDPEQIVEVPAEAVGVEGSSMYLQAGEKLTIRDLLYGLMLQSGNDAAVALAITVSGSTEEFAAEMNRKAAELGLTEIHFANPHGLDSEENYATASSLGRLAAAAMRNPAFREIVSSKHYTAGGRSLTNHNKLLWQYPGAVGVKTGFTKKAGRILVGSAERGGRRLISVTINAPSDWNDHTAMLDFGFTRYDARRIIESGQTIGQIPVMSGDKNYVNLIAADSVEYPMLPGEKPDYRLLTPPFLYAPVEQGSSMGTLQVFVSGKLAANVPLETAEHVEALPEEPSLWRRLIHQAA